jgi:hypothetical protein
MYVSVGIWLIIEKCQQAQVLRAPQASPQEALAQQLTATPRHDVCFDVAVPTLHGSTQAAISKFLPNQHLQE